MITLYKDLELLTSNLTPWGWTINKDALALNEVWRVIHTGHSDIKFLSAVTTGLEENQASEWASE
ncbi:MAG: hypothetical protein V2I33_25890 [Kangiellaceae bacterium]|jgi:hypothetical protein|nr:hypothetical protein [Kangiellaceae bacterium]